MRFSLPLWVKVWLLLALNFAIVGALGLAWFLARGEQGWDQIARGPLGDRVAALADEIADEIWRAPEEDAEGILARHAAEHGVELIWLRNDGLVLAGPSHPLPARVAEELERGDRNGPRRRGRGDGRRDEGGGERLPGPPPQQQGGGRFLVRTDAGEAWFGVRVHPSPEVIERGREPPPRTTLIIRATSTWALGWLLGLHIWVGVAALALGVSVLFWLPFVRSTTRRLDELEQATGRIAEGRFETRSTVSGGDEIGKLGASINSMAQRLESHAETQKKFLGDVAHELGSPLGRLQVAVELLEQRAGPGLESAVADVREEVQQMAELVNELLAFTRAGLRAPETKRDRVALADLFDDVMQRENADGRVTIEAPEGLFALGDAALLRRAVGNLIRNALRYGGGAAVVRATRSGGELRITVDDDGPGVPPDALARLGEPFFRPESARTRETGGVGLGLTIVRSAVAACGGEVRFGNREPRGFRAEVKLDAA